MTKLKILLTIVAFLLFTSLWGFYTSVRPVKIVSTITPKELGLAYEQVTFTTKDGLTLSGWFVPNELSTKGGPAFGGQTKTIILLHGYPADKGDILPALAFLREKYNLFLFDFRYFGQSQGSYSTAGAKETADLIAAIQYLKMRGIDKVGVWGFSMGGAVALMTAPQAPEIKAIASEASYARLDLMARELYRLPLLNYPLAELTRLWTKLFLKVDIRRVAPAETVKNIQIPVFIIHSTNDDVIPFGHALLLQDSLKDNPRADFWFQENLIHGQFDKTYQKKIEDFFLNNL